MPICVTATTGGAGATVTAAAITLGTSGAVLVDLAGDVPAALGLATDRLGVVDWLASDAPADRLDELLVPVGRSDAAVLPLGGLRARPDGDGDPPDAPERWTLLASWCARRHGSDRPVVVDTGEHAERFSRALPPALPEPTLARIVVTRACYLALRRYRSDPPPAAPDGAVVVREPGRTLDDADVAAALGAPVVASPEWDPEVARAVDAGLLTARLPATMRRTGRLVLAHLHSRPAVRDEVPV